MPKLKRRVAICPRSLSWRVAELGWNMGHLSPEAKIFTTMREDLPQYGFTIQVYPEMRVLLDGYNTILMLTTGR